MLNIDCLRQKSQRVKGIINNDGEVVDIQVNAFLSYKIQDSDLINLK